MMQFAAANCLRHSIKVNLYLIQFNETFGNHSDLDIENWKKFVDPSFTTEDFIEMETLLFLKDQYSTNFTTPYDYYGVFSSVFPMSLKYKKATIKMMDLCFTIPELMFFNSEHIFFGCLLVARGHDDIPDSWILNQTFFPEEVLYVK